MAKRTLKVSVEVISEERLKKINDIEDFENEVDDYFKLSKDYLINLFSNDDFKKYLTDKYAGRNKDININEIVENIINSLAVIVTEKVTPPIPKKPS